jgi:hypothetical protein
MLSETKPGHKSSRVALTSVVEEDSATRRNEELMNGIVYAWKKLCERGLYKQDASPSADAILCRKDFPVSQNHTCKSPVPVMVCCNHVFT